MEVARKAVLSYSVPFVVRSYSTRTSPQNQLSLCRSCRNQLNKHNARRRKRAALRGTAGGGKRKERDNGDDDDDDEGEEDDGAEPLHKDGSDLPKKVCVRNKYA